MPSRDDLTILVPTYQRPQFLARLLDFLAEFNVRYPILIADSSSGDARVQNEQLVGRAAQKLDVTYQHFDLGVIPKMRRGVEAVQTPYVVFWADDDFQNPDAITMCVEFLKAHPENSVAMGWRIMLDQQRPERIRIRRQFPIEDDSAIGRFKRHCGATYSTFYGVYRTQQLRRSFQLTDEATDYDSARVLPEFMLGNLSVIGGKVSILPQVQLAYVVHGENECHIRRRVENHDKFKPHFEKYVASVAKELAEADDITENAAARLIRKWFREYYWDTGGRWKLLKKLVREIGAGVQKQRRKWRRRLGISEDIRIETTGPEHPELQHPALQRAISLNRLHAQGILHDAEMSAAA